MNDIVIVPLDGVLIGDKRICLGEYAEDIKAVLGEPERVHKKSLYYFSSELRIDIGADGTAEFIEFLGGTDGTLQPTIYGVSAFGTDADELYGLLAEKNSGGVNDSENGYSYAFLNISVGVYRESIPSDIEEMIAEADSEGFPMSAEDIAEERKKAAFWATIGIGIGGYYGKV